jgi:hypothetical protein
LLWPSGWSAGVAAGQDQRPYIGYVYPAGAQAGTTVQVIVGGQYLDGVDAAYVTGGWVRSQVTRYVKPPSRGRLNQLRNKLRELRTQRAEARKQQQGEGKKSSPKKAGKGGSKNAPRNTKQAQLTPAQRARQQLLRRLMLEGVSDETFDEICKGLRITHFTKKDYIEHVLASRDTKAQPNEQIAETVTLELQIARDAPIGLHDFRLETQRGLTAPLRFEIQALPEVNEREPNDKQPMLLTRSERSSTDRTGALPLLVNGQIQPGEVDRFAFHGRKGMQLVAAAKARVLVPYLADAVPGWFQATLELFGPDGERVAYVDDFAFDPDPILHCKLPETGQYVLEIRDSIYRGRDDFVYRLSIGELPVITGIFPLGGSVEHPPDVRLLGYNLPQATARIHVDPRHPGKGTVQVQRRGIGSNVVPCALSALTEYLEQELPVLPRQEQGTERVSLQARETSARGKPGAGVAMGTAGSSLRSIPHMPCIVSGRIAMPGEIDSYQFKALSGEELVLEITARRLRSPLDSLIEVLDPKGQRLAWNDDQVDRGEGLITHHADSYLRFKAPAAGNYTLRVHDTRGHGSLGHAYRLRLSRSQPDFAIRIVPSDVRILPGASARLTAHALRHEGFEDEIELALQQCPEGWHLDGARIPAGEKSVTFTITAPRDTRAAIVPLRFEGRARIDRKDVTRPALAAEDRMQAFLWRQLVVADELLADVSAEARSPAQPVFAKRGPIRLNRGSKTRVRVNGIPRRFVSQLRFSLAGAPEGIQLGKVYPRSGNSLDLEIQVDRKTAPGLEGNLIFDVTLLRRTGPKGKQRTRRIPIGTLPALPFAVSGRRRV